MYKKILAPLDGSNFSEQVLPYAKVIAEAYRAPVELLHITDPAARTPFWPPQRGDQYLEEISAKYFRSSSVPAATAVEIGKPAEVIVDHAKGDPTCLIAIATHGLSGPRRWLIGSVASKVIQTAANPLLLIRPVETDPTAPVKLDTIFVPLDGSGLAEKILPYVCGLAKALKLEIHFVRVYTLPADAYVIADGVIAPGPAVYREELKDVAEVYLEGKVAELQAEGFDRVVGTAIQGDDAGEIIDLAIRTPNNLIAMSTHGRSGIGRWVLGSVAERVVQHSRDPVLLIRAG